MKKYRIILDEKTMGVPTGKAFITEEGARIIYAAYEKLFGTRQSMDQREGRGGICWLSEIKYWIKIGLLPPDFDWKVYEITEPQ